MTDAAHVQLWLRDYIAIMRADLKQHAYPVGLHRTIRNRDIQRRIDEVITYLAKQEAS
jgi:hypothetical protein